MVFFMHISQRVFAPTRISLLQFPILSFSQFVTIIERTDLYYYFFDGDPVAHQGELAQMVEHSLRMREVLGPIPRFSSLYKACNYCLPKENMWKQNGFCHINTPELLKTDAIVWCFCKHISPRVYAPARISMS